MEFKSVWKDGMCFKTRIGNKSISLDAAAPLGQDKGPSPRDVFAAALASGTGMDIVGLLKKYKQPIQKLEIETHVELGNDYPVVFTQMDLTYQLQGDIEERLALEAIKLSHTKYSGICAMLSKSVVINWRLVLNGKDLSSGAVNGYLSHE